MPREELGLGMAGCNSGSWDSMVSTASNDSQRSDNSYDYLSVEEKECLMFLEETIGSLDAEADSGVSTDETDPVEPSQLPGTQAKRDSAHQGKAEISSLSCSSSSPAPSPASLLFSGLTPEPQHLSCGEGPTTDPRIPRGLSHWDAFPWQARKEHCPYVENGAPPPSEGQQRAAEKKSGKSISVFPGSAPAGVPSPGYYSLPRDIKAANAQRANGASGSKATPRTAEDPMAGGKTPQDVANARSQMKSRGSLIIQPLDPFQDDLVSHEWSRRGRSDSKGEAAKETKTWTSWNQPEKSRLEEAPQDPDVKRGPPTAPKPRKLPPNIILKTSKTSAVPVATEPSQKVKSPPLPSASSQPGSASDAATEKVNSGHLDPKEREKAHREALEKLGLSQGRKEPGVHLQPPVHPQARETPSPVSGDPKARCEAAERSVPALRQMPFKSNTLERSGVGLSSYMASTKEQNVKTSSSLGKMSFIERLAPSFLRSSRPRPVSLGAGKDFTALKEPEQVEQEKSGKRRSHPLQGFPRPARSCVSVKISPKGVTDENRREALKKLGLLKE
ncbi:SARG protein, partial [Piaya cayana]|nr:SARG protein [Piaya cayana]